MIKKKGKKKTDRERIDGEQILPCRLFPASFLSLSLISYFPSLSLSLFLSFSRLCMWLCVSSSIRSRPHAKIRGGPTARSAAAGGWARPWGAIIWSADASSASASVQESPSARRRRPDASRHPVVGPLSCLQSNAARD